jgi:hypothetical protein
MKTCAYVLSVGLLLCLCAPLSGCKTDAAIRSGATVGAGPNTSDKDVKRGDDPTINQPTTDKQAPLKQVQ